MAGFLDEYGVADERRSKVIRTLVISALVLVFGTIGLYFLLRTWPAKRQVNAFLGDLRRHDYQAAYRDWGCGQGCADYPYDKFLEDWGPKSLFADASAVSVKRSRYCESGGVIVTINSPKGDDVPLMYLRGNGSLGFSPWPICDPRVPTPNAR